MKKPLPRNHCIECFFSSFENRLSPPIQFCGELAAYRAAEMDHHKILHVRLVAKIIAKNKELHVAGIRFRYDLSINSTMIYRCRHPLIMTGL
jgi:hypothetical protein